ncbi:hypothetical protein BJV78DRAFT_607166 [Lactifluus subvellereus]|nr:hypothetical protein BJV78DRAFT_607166 [Lactifluus subvellereus]
MIDAHSGTGPTTPPGGQFLHAYAERRNDLPIRNLITFGSQLRHSAVQAIQSVLPAHAKRGARRRVQRIGPAKPRAGKPIFLQFPLSLGWGASRRNIIVTRHSSRGIQNQNRFLTSINNEVSATRNATYAAHLLELDALVLVLFAQDHIVVPEERALSSCPTSHQRTGTRMARGRYRSDEDRPDARAATLHGRLD